MNTPIYEGSPKFVVEHSYGDGYWHHSYDAQDEDDAMYFMMVNEANATQGVEYHCINNFTGYVVIDAQEVKGEHIYYFRSIK